MTEKLANHDHQVWVITNKIEGEKYSNHKNIKIVFVQPVLKYKGGLPPSFKNNIQYFFNATRMGMKIIKENKIDIIHSNNFTPAFVGSFLSFFTSKIHITSVWDIFTLCGCDYWKKWVKQSGISKINHFIGPIFEKSVLKIKCNAIHTISNSSKDDLIKFGAKKPIYIIPPTIEEFTSIKKKSKNKQFLFVGRLVFYKNIEVLIKAISILKKKEKEVQLIIIGGGPQLVFLQNMVKNLQLQENVIIKGYVETKEKFQLISESNAILFPSLCEGFGLVILEAFSQNKPVLVSNIRPMSDIISHEETGFIINQNNEKEWAGYILKLINNPQESQRMGINGNNILKTEYNQKLFYDGLIKMYNDFFTKKSFDI